MRIHVLESNLRMEDKELKYWIAFNRVSRVGRAKMALLKGHFGALSRAWEAGTLELQGAGLDQSNFRHIAKYRAEIDPDQELEGIRSAGVKAVTGHDDDYPTQLGEIYDNPPVL